MDKQKLMDLPSSLSERPWLEERLETLSVWERYALAAVAAQYPPASMSDAVNCLLAMDDFEVCFPAGDYEQLGQYSLRRDAVQLPEDALPYVDLDRLGRQYQSEHPGLFMDGGYVICPEHSVPRYDGRTLPEDKGWSVKLKLASAEFLSLTVQPLRDQAFISENKDCMFSENGVLHCLLALGRNSNDGILIESEGYDYPRYAAYVPGVRDILNAELERAADYIVGQDRRVSFEELEDQLGLTVREGNGLDTMLLGVLERRPEVAAIDFGDGGIGAACQPEFGGQAVGPVM